MKVSFVLNGKPVTIDSEPDGRVVDLLREKLGLTGTKEGCGTGECGACSILVDGESKLSCLMLARQLEGRTLITIEGLSRPDGPLSDLQEAFVRYGAVQCGFCTPGVLIAAEDLLKRAPDADRARIREGISGNLCRCTGYQKIVDAIEAVVQGNIEKEET